MKNIKIFKPFMTTLIISIVIIFLPRTFKHHLKVVGIFPFSLWNSHIYISLFGTTPSIKFSQQNFNKLLKENNTWKKNYYTLLSKYHELQIEYLKTKKSLDALIDLNKCISHKQFKIILASILIDWDSSFLRNSIVINAGSNNGIKENSAVVWGRVVIGRISETTLTTSRVQLITDPGFSIKIYIMPSDRNNKLKILAQGILKGSLDKTCEILYIKRGTKINLNSIVISAPDKKNIWPKGLIIGKISSIDDSFGPFLKIKVEPFIDYKDIKELSEVIILQK